MNVYLGAYTVYESKGMTVRVEVDVNTCTAIMKDAHCCGKVETRILSMMQKRQYG